MGKRNTESEASAVMLNADSFRPHGLESSKNSSDGGNIVEKVTPDSDKYVSERQAIGAIVRDLIAARGSITHKDIILRLVMQIEQAGNTRQQEMLRNALEWVVDVTRDDKFYCVSAAPMQRTSSNDGHDK
jgi:hypothetical protein